jgi:hypothetical protein
VSDDGIRDERGARPSPREALADLLEEALEAQGCRADVGESREIVRDLARVVLEALPPEASWPKACARCERTFDSETWSELPLCGIQDGSVPGDPPDIVELSELRDCPCGSTLSLPLATQERGLAVVTRALLEHRAMLDALRAVQRRCTELKVENRRLRAQREEWTVEGVREAGKGVHEATFDVERGAVRDVVLIDEVVRVRNVPDDATIVLSRVVKAGTKLEAGDKIVVYARPA